MKIYWRPAGVSRSMLLMLALFSLGGITVVKYLRLQLSENARKSLKLLDE